MKVEMMKTTMAIPMAEGFWPASVEHLELRDVNRLIPNRRNANARSDQQLANIAGGIEFGYAKPIRVHCHGMIIARHATLLGVRSMSVIFAKRSDR